uniref:Glyco_trans_2-like domain-containing protein n=1 Tax=Rhabditophanes sp. KR3021 TaxID=114890 RepID=A0AC35TUC2_9BILA
MPIKNGEPFLEEAFDALSKQDQFEGNLEISVYDDGSTDATPEIIKKWSDKFKEMGIRFVSERGKESNGAGYSKNMCVKNCTGKYLLFNDCDDISKPSRLSTQFNFLNSQDEPDKLLVGSGFERSPVDSTARYTRWSNNLDKEQLTRQIFTSHGPTIIAPTWFMTKRLFEDIGGFEGSIKVGFPEDLHFFYKVIRKGISICKIPETLVVYRYHENCTTFKVLENTIWQMRVDELCATVLNNLSQFSIWSVGKQGKRFFRSLPDTEKAKVKAFCDVDIKKLKRPFFEMYDDKIRKVTYRIPIVSVCDIKPPVIVCVKLDMTDQVLEKSIDDKKWTEGFHFIHFN